MKMKNYKALIVILLLLIAFLIGTFTSPMVKEIMSVTSKNKPAELFYSDVLVNGIEDPTVIENDNTLSFTTTFKKKGEKYILEYKVTNSSKFLSADVSATCTKGNEYLKITNDFDTSKSMEPSEIRKGKLTLELLKQNPEKESKSYKVKCTIVENSKLN